MKKIGLFCGSFNPITNSHIRLISRALDEVVDWVAIEAVNDAYPKRGLIESKHRVAMLDKVAGNMRNVFVGSYEVERTDRVWTYETVVKYANAHPEDEIYLMGGSDLLKRIPKFRNCDEIFRCASIICMMRNNDDPNKIIEKNAKLKANKDKIITVEDYIESSISSTVIRRLVGEGKGIHGLTDKSVAFYIEENGLYKGD